MAASHSSLPKTSKKHRTSRDDDAVSDIRYLEGQVIAAVSANSSLNPLADLLEVALNTHNAAHLSKIIYALYRSFITIFSHGEPLARELDENTKTVHVWLTERLRVYVDLLTGLLQDEEPTLRTSALQILLSLQKHLSSSSSLDPSASGSERPQFHLAHFRKIVNALVACPPTPTRASPHKKQKLDDGSYYERRLPPDVKEMFLKSWLNVYDDVRWFFLREAGNLLVRQSCVNDVAVTRNLLSILEGLTRLPTKQSELNAWWVEELGARPSGSRPSDHELNIIDEEEDAVDRDSQDDWRKFFDQDLAAFDGGKLKAAPARLHTLTLHQSLHSVASHRAVFTRTWISLLSSLSLQHSESKALSLRVLNVLHRGVIPHLTRPILIMDWVASCVDFGGTVGLLALNALFFLMKEHNLDYPLFYTRLYAFLDRDVLHLKHRARFFRLTELFLSSTHLPAALVAAFVKRLSRLSVNAPPAAIVMIIPFIYNLFKTHPALMPMIHRVDNISEVANDPFQMHESNPALSNALDSSLWEVYTHKHHYHSVVSTLACIFQEAFTRPAYTTEDFLDHTYGTLYDTEVNRRIRKEPVVSGEWLHGPREDLAVGLWLF